MHTSRGANTREYERGKLGPWAIETGVGQANAPKRRMRHVTCFDAAVAAVRQLTAVDPEVVVSIDEIELLIRDAGYTWPRATVIKVVSRDLAGVGSGGNAPRSVPILERLPGGGGFKLR